MEASLIIWYIFCFFYGSRVTDYFFSDKPKTKERTIFFFALTTIWIVGMINVMFT
jgi:UDP-N-acetylmuramyl pentapeptide phosphotransferase/UDP-N-acetylglucosamine-1-phosphate transferase